MRLGLGHAEDDRTIGAVQAMSTSTFPGASFRIGPS